MKQIRLLTLLVLLLTAATGAWADETPLLTIENKDYTSFDRGSKTFDDKVTVTFSNLVYNFGDESGWTAGGNASLLTVAGTNGYTITSCKFYTQDGIAKTGYTVEGESPSVYLHNGTVYIDDSKSVNIGTLGVTKIEVYGAAPAGYTVSMKSGVKDADKWTISPNPAEEGQTVTLQYNGRLKVKGVKATSDAAAASVPDGALSGVFSVSSTKKVYFSKGNLRYASSKWSFFDNQYDYYESHSADAWDKFGWSTSANTYGMSNSTDNSTYSGDFVDWGATMGAGWFTLSRDEWTYLFTRTVNGGTGNGKSYTRGQSVNGKLGFVIYPDNYTGEVYSGSDWATFESAGCVFLPAAGIRGGSSVSNPGTRGYYWSASPNGTGLAYSVCFTSRDLSPAYSFTSYIGCSVRLVREVATSDAAPAKTPATVTTAPTGAAIVGVKKTTALVSGGVADGGTLWYAVTTTNTKPTSTDGFSADVPTAEDITASGKVYVWYFVKADDTHSDSEIAATAIEVPVADIVWDVTNVSNLEVMGTFASYTMEGVTLSGNGDMMEAEWYDFGNPEMDGIGFDMHESGGFTFTAPTGKNFTKIEMTLNGTGGWEYTNLGSGWALNWEYHTVTWTGSAASTVGLLTGADEFMGERVKSIAFYLSE